MNKQYIDIETGEIVEIETSLLWGQEYDHNLEEGIKRNAPIEKAYMKHEKWLQEKDVKRFKEGFFFSLGIFLFFWLLSLVLPENKPSFESCAAVYGEQVFYHK